MQSRFFPKLRGDRVGGPKCQEYQTKIKFVYFFANSLQHLLDNYLFKFSPELQILLLY